MEILKGELTEKEIKLLYLGYSAIILRTRNHTLIFDPTNLIGKREIEELKNARNLILLYTHDHYDHYDEKTLREIHNQTQCPIIIEPAMTTKTSMIIPKEKLYPAQPGKPIEIHGAKINGIKGLHRGPITLYHIQVDNIGIFHGGDSGYVKLEGYKTDIAITPTGDPSPTASPRDAYKMVIDLKPKIAIPIHGSTTQHNEFKKLVEKDIPEIKVEIIEKGKIYTLKI